MDDLSVELLAEVRSNNEIEIKEIDQHLKTTRLVMSVLFVMATATLIGWILYEAYWYAVVIVMLSVVNLFVGTTHLSLKSRRSALCNKRDAQEQILSN